MDETNRLLTFKEVCERLRRTPAAGRYMLANGDFPKTAKIGGRLMARSSDVDAYLDEKFEGAA